jgi:hypothetical protein
MKKISCPYWGSKPRLTSPYLVTISLDYRGPNSDWKNLNTMTKICANAILPSTITHALTWKLPRDSTVIGQWQLPESQYGLNGLYDSAKKNSRGMLALINCFLLDSHL